MFVPELTTGDASVAVKYEEALAKFPDLEILQALEVVPGKTKESPITIRLKVNTKDAFDENTYTDLMRGLRDDPDTADLYQSLIRVAIAQGTYRTKVSIKNIIPIEDYADVVSNLVRNAQVDDNVLNFQKNNWFQRNNYRDDAVTPRVVPMNYVNYNVPVRTTFSGEELYQYTIPSAISYWQAEEGQIAQKAILGIRVNSKGSGNDLIVVPRLLTAKDGAMVDYQNSKQISKKEYATEASKDVNKYDELYGYQKVKYGDGSPVIMKRNEKAAPEYVYKLVNLYGDGRYTSEYYRDTNMPSQLENGTVKPKEELTDQQIINHLGSMILKPIGLSDTAEVVAEVQPLITPEKSIFEQRVNPINYTAGQTKALEDIAKLIDTGKQGYYLLAGYAGTGKTTIAENIAKYAKSTGRGVVILAPTNKAAKVLNDKLKSTGAGTEAMTIHKAIYGEPDESGEFKIGKAIAPGTVLIIDESSMIDKEVMNDLMTSVNKNNLLIFMGDGFQLEPVGDNPGLFTGNVAQVKDNRTELTEVKRQALDSDILSVATLVRTDNKAYVPSESTEDFKVVNTKREFLDDFTSSIKNDEDSIAIVATNNERIFLNNMARKAKFGPNAEVMEDGETLISVANSSDVSNSELFKAKKVVDNAGTYKIEFTFGNKTQSYDMHLMYINNESGREMKVMHFPDLDKPSLYHSQILKAIRDSNPALYSALDNDQDIIVNRKGVAKLSKAITITTYGYAVTAHKSQGSQWEKVFVNQNYNAPTWNAARWYYTAITRAANQVVVLPTENNVKLTPFDMENKLSNIVSNAPENVVSSQPTEQPECER
jgi:energy-coupling factor transporter ATP-binding protein EcfA2